MKTRKRKSMLSKLLALCFALTAVLSVSLTAFAGEAEGGLVEKDTGSFSVSLPESEQTTSVTVTAYQIITVNIDDASHQPENPMYTWGESVAEWLKNNANEEYKTYINAEDNSVTENFFADDTTAERKDFFETLAAAIKGGAISLTSSKEETITNGTATFSGMTMGEYLLTAQGEQSVNIYQPTTVLLVPEYKDGQWKIGEAQIGTDAVIKYKEPTIEKEIEESGKHDVSVGDNIPYVLNITVPLFPEGATAKHFEAGDTLPSGIVFNNDIKVFVDNTQVTNSTDNEYYTITTGDSAGGKTFIIEFKDKFVDTYGGKSMQVKYTAKVTEAAVNTDDLTNTAYIDYNNDPYDSESSKPREDKEKVYTYDIVITKVDKENVKNKLVGAEFTLAKDESNLKFKGENGVYVKAEDQTQGNEKLVVDSEGSLKIQGLDAGTYILEETKAPGGYVLPNGTITINITANEDGTLNSVKVTTTGTAGVSGAGEDGSITTIGTTIPITVTNANDDGFQLPRTGGIGTMIFTAAGIVIMGCAVVMIIVFVKKRKHMN